MIDSEKIVQALVYILTKIQKADKIKLVKLLYIADKYHLIRYGRTITNDEFWAVKAGPMGSVTSDVLNTGNEEATYFNYNPAMLKRLDDYAFEASISKEEGFEALSESDLEILDIVVSKFGRMYKWDLVKYCHQYLEWKQYEKVFENAPTKRERIHTEELLSTIGDEPFEIIPEHIETSKQILTGMID